jgi:hypothetical protein
MMKQIKVFIAVGFLSACDPVSEGIVNKISSCGVRGCEFPSSSFVSANGTYKNVISSGGPNIQIIDQPPNGQAFLTRNPSLFIAPEDNGEVMVFTASSGIVFIGNVVAGLDWVGPTKEGDVEVWKEGDRGPFRGTGIAYAPTVVNGGRVNMIFANGKTAAPATITGEYLRVRTIRNASIVIQGHEDNPIKIDSAELDNFLFHLSGDPVLVGAPTPAQLVGNYTEADIQNAPTRPLGTFTIDANSSVTGADVFGSFTGRVTFSDTTPLLQKLELTYTPTGGAARTMAGYFLTAPATSPGDPTPAISTIVVVGDSLFDYRWVR